MLILVLEGSGVGFWIKTPLKSSPNDIMLPFFKRGANILNQVNSKTLKPLFCDLLGRFAIWCSSATTTHLPHGFTPSTHIQHKIPSADILLCLSVMQMFRSIRKVTKVLVHGKGRVKFRGRNCHLVTNKKHYSFMYKKCDNISWTKMFFTKNEFVMKSTYLTIQLSIMQSGMGHTQNLDLKAISANKYMCIFIMEVVSTMVEIENL